MKVIPETRGAN